MDERSSGTTPTSGSAAQEDRADALFHALADRTRRDILRRVLAGEPQNPKTPQSLKILRIGQEYTD